MPISFSPKPHLKTGVSPEVWGRVRLSEFLSQPEDEFRAFVLEIERDPLFQRLCSSAAGKERVVSRKPFPGTGIANRRLGELDERTLAGSPAPETAALLEKHGELIERMRRIGLEDFQRFFLGDEEGADEEAVARHCGLRVEDVRGMRKAVDDFCLLELANPCAGAVPCAPAAMGMKVASVEKRADGREPGGYTVCFLLGHYARGRYAVNYRKLYELKARGIFADGEFARIRRLIRRIELVNMRKIALCEVLQGIAQTQARYFDTRDEDRLAPLTQQGLALRLGVHRSTVNRAIHDKSLETPWGEEKSLRFFLRNEKWAGKRRLSLILKEAGPGISDRDLGRRLQERFGIRLARRTVCAYRNELTRG